MLFLECEKITEKVISLSTPENIEPFQSQMTAFLETANGKILELMKQVDDSKVLFHKTLKFYKFTPKSGSLDDCTPGQFFELWAPFTNDFRDIWKKEVAMLFDEM